MLVLIQESTEPNIARGTGRARVSQLVGQHGGFHVTLKFEALEHDLVVHFVAAASVVDLLLGTGHARDLDLDLQDIAAPCGRHGGVGVALSSPSNWALEVEAEASAWVCHSWLVLVAFSRSIFAVERRIGRIDPIDRIGEIFAIADSGIGA